MPPSMEFIVDYLASVASFLNQFRCRLVIWVFPFAFRFILAPLQLNQLQTIRMECLLHCFDCA